MSNLASRFRRFGIIGRSPAFLDTLSLVERLARRGPTALITGETGTGKELMARALHYLGPRKSGPFVPVNCGAIQDTLFEREMFGHVRGAFTDARSNERGLVAHAEGGTLFLDEVDSLSQKAQSSLLRFIQERRYRPVGSRDSVPARVTIISATNADLATRAATGRFRSDLLYRLDVARVDVPPLRDREGDVPVLTRYFLDHFAAYYEEARCTVDANGMAWLESQPWPGNVRQLQNVIHRAWLVAESGVLPLSEGTAPVADRAESFDAVRARVVARFERAYLHGLMMETRGNVSWAARRAGKERRTLGRLLRKHGIDRSDYVV